MFIKKLFKIRSRLDIHKLVFSNRVVDKWNSLSGCCTNCTMINSFKSYVSKELESEQEHTVSLNNELCKTLPVPTYTISTGAGQFKSC